MKITAAHLFIFACILHHFSLKRPKNDIILPVPITLTYPSLRNRQEYFEFSPFMRNRTAKSLQYDGKNTVREHKGGKYDNQKTKLRRHLRTY